MNSRQKASFSSDGEYFAFSSDQGILKIWETSTNTLKQEYVLKSSVNFACSSLIWGPSTHEMSVTDKTETLDCNHDFLKRQSLFIGTEEGELLVYDFSAEKFYSHFASSHTDSVNDLCWHLDSNRLFSCSADKTVSVWDIVSGKLNMKWEADDEPLNSICVIDDDNLLAASTSISWWNVKEQTIIKKFSGHSTEIFSLLPVISTDASSNSYFLSAAAGDSKINAWQLKVQNSKTAVASFNLQGDVESIDATKYFSKTNPMFLSAIVKGGPLLLFKHVLNGKTRKNLAPQMTLHIVSKPSVDNSKPSAIPIIASRFSNDSKSCIIAYGSTENPTFERVKIDDCPKSLTLARDKLTSSRNSPPPMSEVRIYNKLGEYISANGTIPSLNSIHSSPKRKRQKDPEIEINATCEETGESISESDKTHSPICKMTPTSSPRVKKKTPKKVKEVVSPESSSESDVENSGLPDTSSVVDNLLRGLETEDRTALNDVLQCGDEETIRKSVKCIPLCKLKVILLELHRRVTSQENRYNSEKWLKEILATHLRYIIQCEDLIVALDLLKDYIDRQRPSETLLKLQKIKGLLNILRIQRMSHQESNTSDSDTSEEMET